MKTLKKTPEEMTAADQLIKQALLTFEKNRRDPIQPEKYHTHLHNILRDYHIVNEVWRYLLLCRQIFDKDYSRPSNEQPSNDENDLNMIRTLFRNYSNIKSGLDGQLVSAEEQLAELMKIIWNSRDNMLTPIRE